jgi:6-phosphogluconolactonase (cycloisomerase 2 family)
MFRHWLRSLFSRKVKTHVRNERSRRDRRQRPRLHLEKLEDRTLLAVAVNLSNGASWVSVGPQHVTGDAAKTAVVGIPSDEVSGAVDAVAVNPFDPKQIYVGTVNGGVWRTDDASAPSPTWKALTDQEASLAIGALAISPLDSSNQPLQNGTPLTSTVVYAGTGSFSGTGGDGDWAVGVLKSSDGGAHWSQLGAAELTGLRLSAIVPTTLIDGGQVVLAASPDTRKDPTPGGGLYRSADGGVTWTRLSGKDGTGLPDAVVSDVVADPGNPQRFYAAVPGSGVFVSNDGGKGWLPVGDPGKLPGADTALRIRLAVFPGTTDPINNPVYAAVIHGPNPQVANPDPTSTKTMLNNPDNGKLTGLFRLLPQVKTWEEFATPGSIEKVGGADTFIGLTPGKQGDNDLGIVADRMDPNVVYVSGDRQPGGGKSGEPAWADNAIGATTFTARIVRMDFATNKKGNTNGPGNTESHGTQIVVNGAQGTAPHPDSRVLAFDGLDLLDGDDGGLYRLTNPGTTAPPPPLGPPSPVMGKWTSLNGDLQTAEVYSAAYDPIKGVVFTGLQDNGVTAQRPTDAQNRWDTVQGGDGTNQAIAINEIPALGPFASSLQLSMFRYSMENNFGSFTRSVTLSANSSNSSTSEQTVLLAEPGGNNLSGLSVKDQNLGFVGPLPYAINAVDPTRLLLGYNQLYEAKNNGDLVVRQVNKFKGATVNESVPVSAVAYGGRLKSVDAPGVMYVARGNLVFFRGHDGDSNFDLMVEIPTAGKITSIVMDPENYRVAYAVDANHVYATTDNGENWTDITGTLLTNGQNQDLRTAAFVKTFADLRITLPSKQSINVSLAGATTVQDVIDRINAQSGGQVTASIDKKGKKGLKLVATTVTGPGQLTVNGADGSLAALDLGLVTDGAKRKDPSTLTGTDLVDTTLQGTTPLADLNKGNGVRINPAPSDVLLVGGLGGVFAARNPVGTPNTTGYQEMPINPQIPWTQFGTGLPNVVVDSLTYVPPVVAKDGNPVLMDAAGNRVRSGGSPTGDVLVAGTLGRGAYKITGVRDKIVGATVLNVVSTQAPDLSGVALTPQVAGGQALTPKATYQYKLVYVSATDQESPASSPRGVFLGDGQNEVVLTGLPADPTGQATKLRLYRTTADDGVFRRLDEKDIGTAPSWDYTDTIPDSTLLGKPPLDLNPTVSPAAVTTNIRLARGDNNDVQVYLYGKTTPSFTTPLSGLDQIRITGSGTKNAVTLDPGLVVPGGILFDGGAGTQQLSFSNRAGTSLVDDTSTDKGTRTIQILSSLFGTQKVTFVNGKDQTVGGMPARDNQSMDGLREGVKAAKDARSTENVFKKALNRVMNFRKKPETGLPNSDPTAKVEDPDAGGPPTAGASPDLDVLAQLIGTGTGAFDLADIGTTITTPEALRQALDDLDTTPGNVTLTFDAQGFPRFDVQIDKTLDTTADLDLQALGGALSLTGTIDLSLDVHAHLVFGLDTHGFYLDPSAPRDAQGRPEPELTLSNLQVSGDLTGAGNFGFLQVAIDNPTLTVDPSVRLTVDIQDPGTADGKLRASDLLSLAPGLFEATVTGTHTNDVTLSATLSASLGSAPLASSTVTVTVPDITNPDPTTFTVTFGNSDLQNLNNKIRDAVNAGLAKLQDFGSNLVTGALATPLPLVNKSIGQTLDLGDVFSTRLITPVKSYFNSLPQGQPPTAEGLVAALTGQQGTQGNLTMNVGPGFDVGIDGNDLLVHYSFQADRLIPVNLDVGGQPGGLPLTLNGNLDVDLDTRLIMDLTIGVDLSQAGDPSSAFFIRANTPPTVAAAIVPRDVSLSASFGFAGIDGGVGGTLTPDPAVGPISGLPALQGHVSLVFKDPITHNPTDTLTLGQIAGNVTSITNIVGLQASGQLGIDLAVHANLGGLSLGNANLVAAVVGTADVPADHNLTGDTTFALLLDGQGNPVSVFIPATPAGGGPRTIDDLVGDVQDALRTSGLDGQVAVDHVGERLRLTRLGTDPRRSLQVSDANDSAVSDLGLTPGLSSSPVHDPAADPEIDLTDTDLFHQAPTFQPKNFDKLLGFGNIGPAQVLALVSQLGNFLNQYRQSDVFNLQIPFTQNTTLGTLFDLGTSFNNKLLAGLQTSGASLYSQADLPATIVLAAPASFTLADEKNQTATVTIPAGSLTLAGLVTAIQNGLQGTPLAGEVTVSSVLSRLRILRNGTDPSVSASIDPTRTLQITDGSGLDPLHLAAGQKSSDPNAPKAIFNTAQDLANLLVEELPLPPNFGATVAYDPASQALSFHVTWSDTFPTLTVPLNFNLNLGDLGSLSSSAQLTLASDIKLDVTFGVNLGASGPFQLAGALTGVPPANGQPSGAAHFQVTVGANAPVPVTVPASALTNNTGLANSQDPFDPTTLVGDLNDALKAAGLQTRTTDSQGHTTLQDGSVQAVLNTNVIQLALVNSSAALQYSATLGDPAVTDLGFPANGQLRSGSQPVDAVFQLTPSGGTPVTVTVKGSDTAGNTGMFNPGNPLDPATLVGDINAALNATSLNGKITADALGNRIRFQAVPNAGVTGLQINAAATDPTVTLLGFRDGQAVKAQAADLFLGTAPLFQGHVHLALANSTPGQSFASAQFGFLSLAIGQGSLTGDANVNLGFKDPANPTANTVNLKTLLTRLGGGQARDVVNAGFTGSATLTLSQLTANGIDVGAILGTEAIVVSLPSLLFPGTTLDFQDTHGQLGADAHFTIHFGGTAPVTLTINQADTAANKSLTDLSREINTALKAAGLDADVQAAVDGTGKLIAFSLLPGLPVLTGNAQGQLADDGTFTVTATGQPPATVSVAQSSTARNQSMSDLVTEVNAALKAAGVDGLVTAAAGAKNQVAFVAKGGANVKVAPTLAVGNYYQLSLPNLAQLLDFRHLSFTQIIAALRAVVTGLSDITANDPSGYLHTPIPVINRSAADLVDYAQALSSSLDQLAQNPAQGSADLNSKIAQALGINPSQDPLTLKFDAKTQVFQIGLTYRTGVNDQFPLDLDIDTLKGLVSDPTTVQGLSAVSSLVGADVSANVTVQAHANLNLDVGLDLSNVLSPRAFLYDDSGVTIGLKVQATDLHFKAQVGPLGLFIGNGTTDGSATLDADPKLNTSQDPAGVQQEVKAGFAAFGVGLIDSDQSGKHFLDKPLAKDARVSVEGRANVTLPLYFPTQDVALGGTGSNNLVVNVNSFKGVLNKTPGSVSITTPDLGSLLSGLNVLGLLNNPAVLVNGLDTLLGTLQTTLNSQVVGQSFPVVGTHLQDGAQFIENFRQQVITPLRNQVGNNTTTDLVRQVLWNTLGGGSINGSAGLNILLNDSGQTLSSASQIGITSDQGTRPSLNDPLIVNDPGTAVPGDHFVEFHVHLGQPQHVAVSVSNGFDVGVPGLKLSADGTVQVQVGWNLYLGFGVSTKDGFFFDTAAKDSKGRVIANQKPLVVTADVKLLGNTLGSGTLGFLQMSISQVASGATPAELSGTFGVNVTSAGTSGGRLTISQILAGQAGVQASFAGSANVDLHLQASFQGSSFFPSIGTDFHLVWTFSASSTTGLRGSITDLAFNNVDMSLGSFVSSFAGPILTRVKTYLDPIKPVVDALTTRLPVISDLSGQTVTLVDLAATLAQASGDPRALRAVEATKIFLEAYHTVYGLASDFANLSGGSDDQVIHFGNMDLGALDATRPNPVPTSLPASVSGPATSVPDQVAGGTSGKAKFAGKLNHSATFQLQFPLLSSQAPQIVFGLLRGQPADLFVFDMKQLDLSFAYRQDFPIVWPLSATLGGSVSADIHFIFGYDSGGLIEARSDLARTDLSVGAKAAAIAQDVLDGFFIRTDDGPQVVLQASITAGAALAAGPGISGGVEGGIFATVNGSLVDLDGDNKLRLKEIEKAVMTDPLCLFDISGDLKFKLYAYADAPGFHYQKNIVPPITLLSFNEMCSPAPALASEDATTGTLTLNTGSNAGARVHGDTSGSRENFTVTHVGGDLNSGEVVNVTATVNGQPLLDPMTNQPLTQQFSGVGSIVADAGSDDTITLSGVKVPAVITGGDGKHLIFDSDGGDSITINGNGNNVIHAGSGGDTITVNGVGSNQLFGGPGNDVITGGGGNDAISGGGGNDTLSGGGGHDLLSQATGGTAVVQETGHSSYTLMAGKLLYDASEDDLTNVAGASLAGGSGDVTFDVTQWSNPATLTGSGGGHLSTVVSANDADFSLSDTELDRTQGGNTVVFALQKVNNVHLTNTGTAGHAFALAGWSGGGSLTGGTGNDSFAVTSSHALLPNLTVNGGGGSDSLTLTVNGAVTGDSNQNKVSATNVQTIRFDNSDDTQAAAWTLANGALQAGSDVLLSYGGIPQAALAFGSGDDTFTLGGIAGPTTVQTGGGHNHITINDLAAATTLQTGSGTDDVRVGSPGHPLSGVKAALTITGTSGNDTLTIDNGAGGSQSSGSVSSTAGNDAIQGLGMSGQVQYAAAVLSQVTVGLGDQNTSFTVNGTAVPLTINAGDGADSVTVASAAAAVAVHGNADDGPGAETAADTEGTLALLVDRRGDTADHATEKLDAGSLSGLGMDSLTYDGVQTLTLDLGSGKNTMTVLGTGADSTTVNLGNPGDLVTLQQIGGATTVQGLGASGQVFGQVTASVQDAGGIPVANQFAGLTLTVARVTVDDSGNTAAVHWQFSGGDVNIINPDQSTSLMVPTSGALSTFLNAGKSTADTLAVVSQTGADQTVQLNGTTVQLSANAQVLSPQGEQVVNAGSGLTYTTQIALQGATAVATSGDGRFVYVARRAASNDQLEVFRRDATTNQLTLIQVLQNGAGGVSGLVGVTGLALSPDASGQDLYAASDDTTAASGGLVHFHRNPASGILTFGERISKFVQGTLSDNLLPTSVTVSGDGLHVYVNNTAATSNIYAFTRDPGTGQLTADQKANGPAAVSSLVTGGSSVYALGSGTPAALDVQDQNQGLTDAGSIADGAGQLQFGSGDRWLVFAPKGGQNDGQYAYLLDAGAGQLRVLRRDPVTGRFASVVQTESDNGARGLTGASELLISPNGQFLYAIGGGDFAGSRKIAAFHVETTGKITFLGVDGLGVQFPTSAALSPDGSALYVASESTVMVAGNPVSAQFLLEFQQSADNAAPSFIAESASIPASGDHTSSVAVTADRVYLTNDGANELVIFHRDLSSSTKQTLPMPDPPGLDLTGLTATPGLGVAASPDGQTIYVVSGYDGVNHLAILRGFTRNQNDTYSLTLTMNGPTQVNPDYVAVGPDGKSLVFGAYERNQTAFWTAVPVPNAGLGLTEWAVHPAGGLDEAIKGLTSLAAPPAWGPGNSMYLVGSQDTGSGTVPGVELFGNLVPMTSGMGGAVLNGASSVAVSGDGLNAYVPSPSGQAVTVFGRFGSSGLQVIQSLSTAFYTGLDRPVAVALSPDGAQLYVLNQGGSDSSHPPTLDVFGRDTASGLITASIQQATTNDGNIADGTALTVSADGPFVYVLGGTRGTLLTFSRKAGGTLTWDQPTVQDQTTPTTIDVNELRSVVASPDGLTAYGVSPHDDAVVVLGRTGTTASWSVGQVIRNGASVGSHIITGIAGASSVALSPTGDRVYVFSPVENTLVVFDRNAATGQITYDQAMATDMSGGGSLAVNPRRGDVYLAGGTGGQVDVFLRNMDGSLQSRHAIAFGSDISALAVSPDGQSVYLTQPGAKALVVAGVSGTGKLNFVGQVADGQVQNGQTVSGLAGAGAASVSPDGGYVFAANAGANAVAVFRREASTGKLTFVQTLREGVAGALGLTGADAVAAWSGTDHSALKYLFVAGGTANAVAVFGLDTQTGSPNFGKLVYLQRLINNAGGVQGLGAPNSLALDTVGNLYVGSSAGVSGGGLAMFPIAANVPPPVRYQISHSGIETFTLQTGSGNDAIDVLATPAGIPTTINSGDGADAIDVEGVGVSGQDNTKTTLTINTGSGPATIDLRSTVNDTQTTVNTGNTGSAAVHVWNVAGGSATAVVNDGTGSSDTVSVFGLGLAAGLLSPSATPPSPPQGHYRLIVNGQNGTPLVLDAQGQPTDPPVPDPGSGRVAATDGSGTDFGTVFYSGVALTVNGSPPTARAAAPASVAEGGSLTLDGSGSSAASGHQLVSYGWAVNGSGLFVPAPGGQLTLSWSELFALGVTDEGTFSARLRVTDDQGQSAETAVSFTVGEGTPSLSLTGDPTVRVGDTYVLTLQASDPSADAPPAWTVSWGDNTPGTQVTGNLATATHVYRTAGNFTITATANATDGAGTSFPPLTQPVQAQSLPRAQITGAPYAVSEGGSLTLDASTSFDPDASQQLSFAWSINGQGNFAGAGTATPTLTWAQLTSLLGAAAAAPGTYPVSVVVTDNNGSDTATTTLTINDVPPTLTLTGDPRFADTGVNEGTSYTLQLAAAGAGLGVDPIQSWTINWGDGTTPQTVSGNPPSVAHTYAQGPNGFVISATASDKDGTYTAGNTVAVVVNAVPPTLTMSGPSSLTEGSTYTLNLHTSGDPDNDPLKWLINWGDGSSMTVNDPPAAPPTHQYAQGGQKYFITVEGTDENGLYDAHVDGSGLLSLAVQVLDAPLVLKNTAVSAVAGAPFSGPVASFTDADPNAAAGKYTVTIQWGDGAITAGTVQANGAGSFTVLGSHIYNSSGSRVINVLIQDVGGSFATAHTPATVAALGAAVGKGQSASIGFWHGSRGQALINSFNGGAGATALSAWLAATFPNLYGASAGSRNLTGKSNAQVAAFFQALYSLPGGALLDTQVLATALNVYASTLSLGGTAAAAYGFQVSALGLGASSFNVGNSGAVFGLYNNLSYNVYVLLREINARAVDGLLWGGYGFLRGLATAVFDGINRAGGL